MGALTKWSRKPDAVYLNALVYYKGQLWAVKFVDGFGFSLMRWIDRERMETCGLWIFESEEKKKSRTTRSTHPSKQIVNRIQERFHRR